RLSLFDHIESLPNGYYIIGDSAYNATEHLLPIFCGQDRKNVKNDAWNYYASQLRIRIEMSFGLMVMKWQFLRRPLCIKYDNIPKALNSIARLH
ncbi:transposase family protein, partial [Lacticaseibacillus paracasei]